MLPRAGEIIGPGVETILSFGGFLIELFSLEILTRTWQIAGQLCQFFYFARATNMCDQMGSGIRGNSPAS
jgi:hypothetical protein